MNKAKWVEISENTLRSWIQGLKIAIDLIPDGDARRVYPAADLKTMTRIYEENFGVLDGKEEVDGTGLVEDGGSGDTRPDTLLRDRESRCMGDGKLKNFDAWKKNLKSTDPVLRAAYTASCDVGVCPAREFCNELHVPLPCKDRWDMWAGSTKESSTCE